MIKYPLEKSPDMVAVNHEFYISKSKYCKWKVSKFNILNLSLAKNLNLQKYIKHHYIIYENYREF